MKLPTYPDCFSLKAKSWVRGGVGGQFPRNPGFSLRGGGRGFPPATFIGKQKKNRTKRNP